jgi:polyhydroxyalkanoate synthesis regulator phasin
MGYTLGEAAKATGKAKTTIQRAIKSGRISASKSDAGSYDIEPSELHRVFPKTVAQQSIRNDTQHLEKPHVIEADVLQVKVEMLEQQLRREEETTEDLRKRLDRAENRIVSLTDQRTPQIGKGWFDRLLGR